MDLKMAQPLRILLMEKPSLKCPPAFLTQRRRFEDDAGHLTIMKFQRATLSWSVPLGHPDEDHMNSPCFASPMKWATSMSFGQTCEQALDIWQR